MTLMSKANLAVVGVAETDSFHRGLCAVKVEHDGTTVAGTAKIMLAVSPVQENRVPFPNVGTRARPPEGGISLPVDLVKEAKSNIPRDKQMVLQHVAMTQGNDSRKVELTTITREGRERRVADFPVHDPFPEWRGALEAVRGKGADARVLVDRKQLIQLLQAIEEACPDKADENQLFLEMGEGGLVCRSVNRETGQRAVGVVRAYRAKGWLEPNEWEQPERPAPAQAAPTPLRRRS